jgi:membrane protease YdiL (CAAX protease family)
VAIDRGATPLAPPAGSGSDGPPWTARDIVLAVVVWILLIALSSPTLLWVVSASGLSPSRTASFVLLGTDAYLCLSLSVWWFCLRRHDAALDALGFRRTRWGVVAAMVPLSVGLLLTNGVLVLLTSAALGGSQNPQAETLAPQGILSTENFVLLFLLIAIVAPVGEELLFRGMLYRYLRARRGVTFAVALSAGVFALAHVVPVLLPALFILGIVLALVAERSASIYPAIVLHALNNGISLVILYAASSRA